MPAWRTPEAVEQLCQAFLQARDRGQGIDLILIGYFVLDFLSIQPFPDGNSMARLLTLWLLYQSGYVFGRCISLERVIEGTKEQYDDTLSRSSRDGTKPNTIRHPGWNIF